MTAIEKSENVRAVGRALEILLAFTAQDFELTPGELLKRVDLSRPTLYRLLYTLQEHGFLVSSGDPQRFRLGPSVANLAHVWTSSLDLSSVAQPLLQAIWRETKETVAMFVPQGSLRLCVAELPSPQPLNFKRGVGYTERIVRGASGRAILAFLGASDEELHVYTKESGVEFETLKRDLEQTRQRGYATSHNELISGAVAVAAPFFDQRGAVAGSIGVFGPEVRLNPRQLADFAILLTSKTEELSSMLGYRGVPQTAP